MRKTVQVSGALSSALENLGLTEISLVPSVARRSYVHVDRWGAKVHQWFGEVDGREEIQVIRIEETNTVRLSAPSSMEQLWVRVDALLTRVAA